MILFTIQTPYYQEVDFIHISNRELTRYCSFMAPTTRADDVSVADWRSQTDVENYRNISHVEIRFFSVVKISINPSSLYNKVIYPRKIILYS